MVNIAFIGLGNMGGPMSANLVKAGNTVHGFDLSEQAKEQAAAAGVKIAASIKEAVQGADAVITSLPKDEHVRAVYDGEDGIWANAPAAALLADTSTVDITTSAWCHEQSRAKGFDFADTPVSGGTVGAEAGSLTIMVGAEPEIVERARELVAPMGANVISAGGPTAGIAAKLVNNMMLFITELAVNEGSVLADKLGLDAQVFWDIASVSSANCWALQKWYPIPGVIESAASNHNFDATFRADLALKDVSLAVSAAEGVGVKVPAAKIAKDQLEQIVSEGLGDKDCTLTIKYASPDGSARGYTP